MTVTLHLPGTRMHLTRDLPPDTAPPGAGLRGFYRRLAPFRWDRLGEIRIDVLDLGCGHGWLVAVDHADSQMQS